MKKRRLPYRALKDTRVSPGLQWTISNKGITTARWVASATARKDGYPIKTQRLWKGKGKPSEQELVTIFRECRRLQDDLYDWLVFPNRRRPTRLTARVGCIYFVRCGHLVKIGFTTSLKKR